MDQFCGNSLFFLRQSGEVLADVPGPDVYHALGAAEAATAPAGAELVRYADHRCVASRDQSGRWVIDDRTPHV
jgi:hypothetical protein